MTSTSASEARDGLQRLKGFLERDPTNIPLLSDAAGVAFAAGEPAYALALLDRIEAQAGALSPPLTNLKGLIALSDQRYEDAAALFEALAGEGDEGPAVRFNLAWTKAMTGDYAAAADLLDPQTIEASPHGPALKVRMLHHLGRLEEALALGEQLAARHPEDANLSGALAAVALDDERMDAARAYALRAGDDDEGVAVLGLLVLDDEQPAQAEQLFDQALARHPDNARALLGKGLTRLLAGDAPAAIAAIDRAAERFERHIGSWVAAGWACFTAGDLARARHRFERALALDDRFAETQGALAVLDILEGHPEAGRRRMEVALRLDRRCLGAALAKVLILSGEGQAEAAERVRAIALNTPIAPGGRTIAQAVAGFGLVPGARPPRG